MYNHLNKAHRALEKQKLIEKKDHEKGVYKQERKNHTKFREKGENFQLSRQNQTEIYQLTRTRNPRGLHVRKNKKYKIKIETNPIIGTIIINKTQRG